MNNQYNVKEIVKEIVKRYDSDKRRLASETFQTVRMIDYHLNDRLCSEHLYKFYKRLLARTKAIQNYQGTWFKVEQEHVDYVYEQFDGDMLKVSLMSGIELKVCERHYIRKLPPKTVRHVDTYRTLYLTLKAVNGKAAHNG